MTFCTYYEDCIHASDCRRPLTIEVQTAAKDWWGGNDPPISMFSDKPCCHEEKPTKE